ncbi:MAG: hypothetical protein ACXVLQ_04850 [Bacteriovorax sp.]
MKKLIFSLLVISNVSFAAAVPGAQMLHTLKCSSTIIPLVGSQVGLQVITQALAPEINVRGISLTTKALVANAETKVTPLKQESQTAYNAIFSGKNVKVLLDKNTFTAELSLGAISYTCKK